MPNRPLHDGLDVREVQVDQARGGDQIGDAGDTGQQNLVRGLEGIQHGHVAVRDGEQTIVGDHDERVHFVAQGLDAVLSLVGTATSLEGERAGDHTDGQGTQRASDASDDRRATGAGAAAFTGGHEDHVSALEHFLDFFFVVLGSLASDIRVGSGAEAPGQFTTDVELDVCVRHQQCLCIGVDGDELNAAQTFLDHAVDSVDTAAADADHLDDSQVVLGG